MFSFNLPKSPQIPDTILQKVTQSPLLQKWLNRVQRHFKVRHIEILSIDFRGPMQNGEPLFVKLYATAFDLEGKPALGITFLRGDAVAVLPILIHKGQEYILGVRQARFPSGDGAMLEIPAGMLDGEDDPIEVAVKELQEEAGLKIDSHQLIALPSVKGETCCYWSSPGLTDEKLHLYACEINVTQADFERLKSHRGGVAAEGEYLWSEVLKPQEFLAKSQDSKSLLAYFLYQHQKGI